MSYLIGVDTGGTFTDCVLVGENGRVFTGKALSTRGQLEDGVLGAIEDAAGKADRTAGEVLADTAVLCHATTAGLNELYTRSGARVALVTTRGHEDAIAIGRVYQKAAGLGDIEVTDTARLHKPAPLVEPARIFPVRERVDGAGAVVVPLTDAEIERVVEEVAASEVDAVAVSLLWSFKNAAHERALAAALRRRLPDAYLSVSSDVSPVLGEYERSITSVINSYVGPTLQAYLRMLAGVLAERGLPGTPLMMQSNGGVFPLREAGARAVNILHSGPAGGVIGGGIIGPALGYPNIVTTDVGGTSFDVSLVVDGEPILSAEPELARFSVFAPMIDVRSIGAGGGSIASVDAEQQALRVGPKSAGSDPGPACYGRGGTLPTVTDANLVLGRLNAEGFFGGRIHLDRAAAERAIDEHVARPLGMSVAEAASGIVDIADNLMADLVRRMTTERGYDARDFILFAFGGGGPVHVGAYGASIGARAALIPAHAAVFSALGIACADAKHFGRISSPAVMPFDADVGNEMFERLEREGTAMLAETGFRLGHQHLVSMRFRNQTHEVPVPVTRLPLTAEDVLALRERFFERYEARYGAGTALPGMVVEAVTFEVVTTAYINPPRFEPAPAREGDVGRALTATRRVVFAGREEETAVYQGPLLAPGDALEGPALIESATTTVVVHGGQRVAVDELGNLELTFANGRTPS